jgi:hypothetical protein
VAKEKGARPREASGSTREREPGKEELQRQMMEARESISQTVDEIKETVEDQYESVKKTVTGVFDLREQFQSEPILWSVGALSAGFALGYTLGYAHKNTRSSRGKRSEVAAFADSLIDELSTLGNSLVLPSLNVKIKELFGFDFSDLLEEIGGAKKAPVRKKPARKGGAKKRVATKGRAKKKAAAS